MNPELKNLSVEDSWVVSQGEYQCKPLIARTNHGLISLVADARYQHCVGVKIQFSSAGENGMPSREESRQLIEVEDLIAAELEQDHESLFAAILTTSGMREFLFYTSDPHAVKKKLVELAKKIHSHPLRYTVRSDPEWSIYRRLVQL